MKNILFAATILISQLCFTQTTADTIKYLKGYSEKYLDLLFNKRDIDASMNFWAEQIKDDLKRDYSNHKQRCDSDSMLKILFADDVKNFCNKVNGKITFQACDDKEGINIVYMPTPDTYYFLINYDFYGEFEAHNQLMSTFLNFQSFDKGKSWILAQDEWIRNYMVINYFRKDELKRP